MNKIKYDFVFITNIPSFYKKNLYNEIAKHKKILVLFFSPKSNIRNDDFVNGDMNFDYKYLTDSFYEDRKHLLCFIQLVRILSVINYDRIIYSGWESVECIILSFLVKKSKNSVVVESSVFESKIDGIKGLIKKFFIKRMSYAYPSGFLQNELLSKLNYKMPLSVTHGVGIFNKNNNRTDFNKKDVSNFKYLYVGRIAKEKNIHDLINTFNSNGKKLTLVGDGPLFEVEKKRANKNISFLGYISNLDLSDIYLKHDIFILPSISEPWGLVIDEALWFGLPVIVSSKVGCSKDLVLDLKTGVIFDNCIDSAISEIELKYNKFYENVQKIDFDKRDIKQIQAYLTSI